MHSYIGKIQELMMSYIYYFEAPTENDSATVYPFSDNLCKHTKNLTFACTHNYMT